MISVSSLAAEQRTYTANEIAKVQPAATIEVDAEQIRLSLGGAMGKGVLIFPGKAYPFTVKAVTAGGAGVTKVHSTGDVYLLKSDSDFAGTYSALTAGATVGAGVGASQYQNGKAGFTGRTASYRNVVAGNLSAPSGVHRSVQEWLPDQGSNLGPAD